MKRKSTLILIATLVLLVTIPAFAFAAGYGNSTGRVPGRGNTAQAPAVQQGAQLMLQDRDLEDCDCEVLGTGLGADGEALHQFALGNYQVDENGFCYYLDANGEPQRVYSRGANGEPLYLQLQDGEYCWSDGTPVQLDSQIQLNNSFGGRGGARWN